MKISIANLIKNNITKIYIKYDEDYYFFNRDYSCWVKKNETNLLMLLKIDVTNEKNCELCFFLFDVGVITKFKEDTTLLPFCPVYGSLVRYFDKPREDEELKGNC